MKKVISVLIIAVAIICCANSSIAKDSSTKYASSYIPDGVYKIYPCHHSGFCVTNKNGRVANTNPIIINNRSSSLSQLWRVDNVDGGIVLSSLNDEDYVIDNYGRIIADGNNVVLHEFNGSNAQIWIPYTVKDNVYILCNADNQAYVLDLDHDLLYDGNRVMLNIFNGGNNQKWRFEKVGN